jgi:Coenzyme PQQ synthesis protein D (PqqD)
MKDKVNTSRPRARQQDLIIKDLDGETLIYDLRTDRAHCLNSTAALVWKHCDGRRSVRDLGELLSRDLSLPAGLEMARLAVFELAKKKLIVEVDGALRTAPPVSRRALVRSLGVALGSLPLIYSILSPTPAEAATCLSSGHACSTSAECCSGLCLTATTGTCA